MERVELLPCPFCGAAGSLFDSPDHSTAWEGGCSVEGCPGFEVIWKETQAEAIAAWNTRATRAIELREEGFGRD